VCVHRSLDDLADGSFDCLYADQVLEHIADPAAALASVVAKLARGGLARVAVPDASRAIPLLRAAAGRPIKVLWPFEHINGFTHVSLVRMCERAGLTVLPGTRLAGRLLRRVRPGHGLDYLPEALKSLIGQRRSTTLYLTRTH
jgi:hypothetical protein